MNRVLLSTGYYPEKDRGRPIANAAIYVGKPDTDPEIVGNQIQLYAQEEDGTIVSLFQPVYTNAGGTPTYNGSPVTLLASGAYSLKVLDSAGVQQYYVPRSYEVTIATLYLSEWDGSLPDAISSIGSDDTTLIIDVVPNTLTADLTIQANVALEWYKGCVLGGAFTLTINGSLSAGAYQLFESNLTVTGLNLSKVSWFGAKGDGVTDDTSAITNAIAAGTDIVFAEGIFLCNAISISKNNIKISGAPDRRTTIAANGIVSTAMWYITGDVVNISGLNFTVDTATYPSVSAIVTSSNEDFTVKFCSITGGANGILLNNTKRALISKVDVSLTNVECIKSVGLLSSGNVAQFCTAQGSMASHGIQFYQGNYHKVINNICHSNGYFGVYFSELSHSIANNNILYNNAKEGLNFQDTSQCIADSNIIYWSDLSSEDFGMSMWGTNPNSAALNKFSNNTIRNAAKAGIGIADKSVYNTICDNVIISCNSINVVYDGGIYVYVSGDNNVFKGNTIIDFGVTMDWGYYEEPTVSNSIIDNNTIKGITTEIKKNLTSISAINEVLKKTFTATVASTSGTITTASGVVLYNEFQKYVFIEITINVTTNGTGSGSLTITLPFNASSIHVVSGRSNNTGKMLQGLTLNGSNLLTITNYDASYPVGVSGVLKLSGMYFR